MRFYIRSWVFFRQKVWTSLALAWLRLEPQWRVVEPLNLFGSTRHVSSRHTVNSGVEWWSIHYVTDFSRQYRLHRGCWSALMFDLREDFGSFFFVIFRGPPWLSRLTGSDPGDVTSDPESGWLVQQCPENKHQKCIRSMGTAWAWESGLKYHWR